mmetsp:Transcript_53250/g.130485  ORF Transcript_53250/g.130485 Transcript_53250/m.130485 type:complete len:155 (+) Transcript_53250:1-465(+)
MYTFKSDVKLVKMVNDCRFGLGSSIFCKNLPRAQLIANTLKVGMVNHNDFGINYLCQSLPFGGTKDSGSDRFAGIEGLRGCCLLKSTTRDKIPFVGTPIPGPVNYPIKPNGYEFLVQLMKLMYEVGSSAKVEILWRMGRMMLSPSYIPKRDRYD